MKKKILIALACLVAIAGVFCAIYFPNSEINETISEVQETIIEEIQKDEVVVTKETQELVNETLEAIENEEEIETTEVLESSIEEEENLEKDAQVEQENIAWEGTATGDGLSLLGEYQGLTYYNQTDSRWGSLLYTSTGNSTQTIASSGCRTNCSSNCG